MTSKEHGPITYEGDELHAQLTAFVESELRHRFRIASPDDTAGITRRYIDLWCQLRSSDALQRIARLPDALTDAIRTAVESGVESLRDDGTIDRIMDAMGIARETEGKAS
jgi:hypothetical protein